MPSSSDANHGLTSSCPTPQNIAALLLHVVNAGWCASCKTFAKQIVQQNLWKNLVSWYQLDFGLPLLLQSGFSSSEGRSYSCSVFPWERELRIRFAQFSEKGSELVGFGVESPDLDNFFPCIMYLYSMKDVRVVRMSGKSKPKMFTPQLMQIRKAGECRTWQIRPDKALQLTWQKKLWKDLAEVYEMMGHHARVTFSTLPWQG